MRNTGRIWICCLTLVCGGLASGGVLVHHDFDGDSVDTGPSLIVWEDARGRVTLSSDYAHSGHRSVEISDVSQDGDFTELQGHFPQQKAGRLTIRLAFMTAEPDEEFNIAFAGPGHFYLRENGMGFWLKAVDGTNRSWSSRIWPTRSARRARRCRSTVSSAPTRGATIRTSLSMSTTSTCPTTPATTQRR